MARHIDASTGECHVFTYKEGLLSAVAHDLKIKVDRWRLEVDDAQAAIVASFDATSLRVVCSMRDGHEAPGVISAKDAQKIEASTQSDVLQASQHREVRFRSTAVVPDGEGYRVDGELTLVGRTRPVSVGVRRDGDRLVAEVRLHQPDFGIKPFSAMFGALKIQPGVLVRLAVPV